jgi:hypothetical protein
VDLHAFLRSRLRCSHVAERPLLAQGCRLGRYSKVISNLGYTGLATNVVGMAARDPKPTWTRLSTPERCNRVARGRTFRPAPSLPARATASLASRASMGRVIGAKSESIKRVP